MARDDDRELLLVERDEGAGALKWLVVGAVVGAGLALLFAPKAGKSLRGDIRRGARRARRLAEDAVDDLKESFGSNLRDRSESSGGEVYAGDDADLDADAGAGSARAERPSIRGARAELERRLAAARSRRRRTVPDEDEEPVA